MESVQVADSWHWPPATAAASMRPSRTNCMVVVVAAAAAVAAVGQGRRPQTRPLRLVHSGKRYVLQWNQRCLGCTHPNRDW
jgi:hypothetical protein